MNPGDTQLPRTIPETRLTLLQRLPDAADDAAWRDFVDLYGPVIYGFCLRRGCPEPDAADLVQETLATVARRIHRFDYDPARGRFRSWLFTIVKHKLIDRSRRLATRPAASADGQAVDTLPDESADPDALWEAEYRRQLFHLALPMLRPQFQPATWEAFCRTALEEADPVDVSRDLGLSLGAVYVAKSRVMARLREKVAQLDREWEPAFSTAGLAAAS